MKIEQIDKNFQLATPSNVLEGKAYYSLPCSAFPHYGVLYDEKIGFHRLDPLVAQKTSDGVNYLNKHTAGGRVRFSTDSTTFTLSVKYDELTKMSHMALLGQSGFILLEEGEKERKVARIFPPNFNNDSGFSGTTVLQGKGMRNYILYFPLYNGVRELTIELDENAKIGNGRSYRDEKPILYYGSSITQGGCASRPDNSYQALISKWNNIDFINLGFSGNGKAEPVMADYLGSIDCSIFVCDYDYNASTLTELKERHYPLYARYRELKPTTPILFISKPDFEYDAYSLKRERVIRETYKKAKALGDENVYFLAGKTLYGKKDRENCSVDSCHPNDLGFYRMAEKIYKKLISIDEKYR
ncbi:MAG: hypothetical protein IJW58_03120 [Clostridia bacterium]|nr:hypothetical protein [Clostridia bacterium]